MRRMWTQSPRPWYTLYPTATSYLINDDVVLSGRDAGEIEDVFEAPHKHRAVERARPAQQDCVNLWCHTLSEITGGYLQEWAIMSQARRTCAATSAFQT